MRHPILILAALSIAATPWIFGQGINVGGTVVNVAGWEDVQLILTQSFNPGAGSGGPGLAEFPAGSIAKAYLFDDTTDECLYGSLQLSHSYNDGQAIYCHIHWAPITNSTNSVNWQIYYSITPMLGAVGAATMLDVSDAGDGTPHKHQIASFPTIACASCGISSVMLVQICRDADQTNGTDDMAGDVAGLSFDCHIPIDTVGSAAEDTTAK